MKNLLPKQWWFTVVAVVVFASASLAQTTTSITLTGVGDSATLGDVYVDPYTATVGGQGNTTVFCDDWSNNSYIGESWTASVVSATAAGSTDPMFGSGATGQSLYNELAWLGSQMLANIKNTTVQTEISFAMWALTYGVNSTTVEDPAPLQYLCSTLGGTFGSNNTCSGLKGSASTEYQATLSYLNTATTSESGYNSAGWEILTPDAGDPITCGSNNASCPSVPPQEFITYTPESSTAILLAGDLLGLASLMFLFRRRLARSTN